MAKKQKQKQKIKVIESGPLYPGGGEDIQVQWFYLPDQGEDEQPLGCRCVHEKCGAKRKSEEFHLARKGNLIRALKKLLNSKKWMKYAKKQKKDTWSGNACEVCNQTQGGNDNRGNPTFTVDPCEKCLGEAESRGYEEGSKE